MAVDHIDVLVLTALREELDALLQVTAAVRGGWTPTRGDPPLHVAVLEGRGGPIRVAAARLTKMGGVATASRAARLIEVVKPRCIAMCGVCAGHPEDTDLGDVVIAERLFQQDEGKSRHDGFQRDLWVDALRDDWLHVAQDMAGPGTALDLYAAPAGDAWKWWFLERLAAGRDPLRSNAFRRYFPDDHREEYLQSLRRERLVKLQGRIFALTNAGKTAAEERRVLHGTLVIAHPFHIHVGPMGSGNAVEADGAIWGGMAAGGMRKVLAVEMEAAAIGRVAYENRLPFAIVKGVMDHADSHKSDRFKEFAARAAAEVLCKLLREVPLRVTAPVATDHVDLLMTTPLKDEDNAILERVVEATRASGSALRDGMQAHARHAAALDKHIQCAIDSDAIPTDLREVAADTRREVEPQSGLKMLVDWARRKDAPPYTCVLGEFGIGKTTLLKRFTLELLKRREKGEAVPMPIFLDLRTPIESINADGARLPELEELLGELMRRTWNSGGPAPEPAQLLQLVRNEGAVMIIDGLDEKLVHLDEARGMELIQMLWGILPPARHRSLAPGQTTGRIVISCRSHLFPTLQRQNYTLAGDLRDEVRAKDYLAMIVLPFNEDQIREYLRYHLGDEGVQDAIRLIASIHNLSELAPRPLFLDLIRRQIGRLEELAAHGEPVRGVSLYDHLVAAASARDAGKHTIAAEDKPRFMEALAAAMWRDGAREWPWERVFHWLRAHIYGDPVLWSAYESKLMTRLAEDFRTATMVLRPDQGDGFRFAHTSLQEYFLARWLHRALVEDRPESWILPMPSDEALDFLGQLLVVRGGDKWQTALRTLLEQHRPQASRIAFRYWLLACDRGHPQPHPARVCLPGEVLDGWTIAGADEAPLLLRGADLRGASLRNANLRRVDLSSADLRELDGVCAAFEDVIATGVRLEGADFTGSVWRDCRLDDVQGEEVRWWDSEWVRSTPPSGVRHGDAATAAPPGAVLERREGHSDPVRACAYSPDGRSIVSASFDNTLKVWDATSGRALLTLYEHTTEVTDCMYSPDGRSIVSSSWDKTLKVWDATSGRALLTLIGHSEGVLACAYSPDGRLIVSGSGDKTLKVWDVVSGRTLHTLSGHSGSVRACAFSPNGRSIVSGSRDKTLKVWDTASSRVLLTLSGHSDEIQVCAYSPDGRAIVSGSADKTLKVWDAVSGRVLLTLSGHSDGVGDCAYNPNGHTIVSSSRDRTLKVWDATSGRVLQTIHGGEEPCAHSPDGRAIACGGNDNSLKVWDLTSSHAPLELAANADWTMACAYSRDGRSIVSASADNSLRVWDVASGRTLLTLRGHSDMPRACMFSPDGRSIVSVADDATLKVWDATSGRVLLTISGYFTDCAYSPDGRAIVSAVIEGALKVWDAATGSALLNLSGHSDGADGCAYGPNGRFVVSASYDGTLKMWDTASGRALRTLSGHSDGVMACACSPDGHFIVSASSDGTLKVWSTASGRVVSTLIGHRSGVASCAYSPDGRSIVSASHDGTLKVWDTSSGRPLVTVSGHSASLMDCDYSPDGRAIISASLDGTTRMWDATTGQLLRTMWHYQDAAAALDHVTNCVLWATPNAWRYLCYRGFDPERGAYRIYPVEAFGPLPTT